MQGRLERSEIGSDVSSLGRGWAERPLLFLDLALGSGNVLLDEPSEGDLEREQPLEGRQLLLPLDERRLVGRELSRLFVLLPLAL